MPTTDALGPLEMQVLGLLDPSQALSVHAVQARLAQGGAELAYTTVMTVLGRLHAKGVVARVREGKRYLYLPAKQATHVSRGILARIQDTLFASDRTRPILALLEDERLSKKELAVLREAIDAKMKGKKR